MEIHSFLKSLSRLGGFGVVRTKQNQEQTYLLLCFYSSMALFVLSQIDASGMLYSQCNINQLEETDYLPPNFIIKLAV